MDGENGHNENSQLTWNVSDEINVKRMINKMLQKKIGRLVKIV